MSAVDVDIHPRGAGPLAPWPPKYACEAPEANWDGITQLGFDYRCRACMLAAVAYVRSGLDTFVGTCQLDGKPRYLSDLVTRDGDMHGLARLLPQGMCSLEQVPRGES